MTTKCLIGNKLYREGEEFNSDGFKGVEGKTWKHVSGERLPTDPKDLKNSDSQELSRDEIKSKLAEFNVKFKGNASTADLIVLLAEAEEPSTTDGE